MSKTQQSLAGKNAIDCGVGHIITMENNTMSSDRKQADSCAVAALRAGKPYRVRYDDRIDDHPDGPQIVSSGSVRTPKGEVYFFYSGYDNRWWLRNFYCRQAICPEPVIYQNAVGCGTCKELGSIDTANCIIHP